MSHWLSIFHRRALSWVLLWQGSSSNAKYEKQPHFLKKRCTVSDVVLLVKEELVWRELGLDGFQMSIVKATFVEPDTLFKSEQVSQSAAGPKKAWRLRRPCLLGILALFQSVRWYFSQSSAFHRVSLCPVKGWHLPVSCSKGKSYDKLLRICLTLSHWSYTHPRTQLLICALKLPPADWICPGIDFQCVALCVQTFRRLTKPGKGIWMNSP